jgi:phage anti-repressor protein
MQELIAISKSTVSGKSTQTINARDLWVFLESKQDFSTWIKSRIEQYGFIEHQDFVTFHKKVERQTLQEYHISLDMAKELSMVERNEKGKEARQYFISCEKQAKQLSTMEMVILSAQAVLRIEQQQEAQNKAIEAQNSRLDSIEAKNKSIEAATSAVIDGHGFYSILGYCNRNGIKIDKNESAAYGRKATTESKVQGVMMGSVPDARYGSVKTYHSDILDIVFAS